MTPEQEQKAERTLVTVLAQLPSRQARKAYCKHLGVEWEEYQHLKRKYSRPLERLEKEKEECTIIKI